MSSSKSFPFCQKGPYPTVWKYFNLAGNLRLFIPGNETMSTPKCIMENYGAERDPTPTPSLAVSLWVMNAD